MQEHALHTHYTYYYYIIYYVCKLCAIILLCNIYYLAIHKIYLKIISSTYHTQFKNRLQFYVHKHVKILYVHNKKQDTVHVDNSE